jgi:Mg-chelatase subunit ChlD
MNGRIADSGAYRLITVPPGGPLRGHAVSIPAGTDIDAGRDIPCLMTVRSGSDTIHTAVHGVPIPEVPVKFLAIGADLAAEWDADLELAQWTLDRADPVFVSQLTLEVPVERDLAEEASGLARAGLADELLWIPADGSELSLTVGDLPYRVRSIDVGGRTGVIGQITKNTRMEVYAPAMRAGVDIVILADCSGSMGLDDLPAGGGRRSRAAPGERWMTRMDALKQSLGDLLSVRLQMSGRISRLALVEFNHRTRQLFPPGGGMAQLDGSSPQHDIDAFSRSVKQLRPSGLTNIGNALYEAANLLQQHGHVGNEKLIVLASDGADWTPEGEEGSGEVLEAVSEPVSLMMHLHEDVGIRLHAIGISTPELYRRRGYHPANAVTKGMVPDHQLLRELVKVGGGDPSAIGGLNVLEEFFSGLGTGLTHTIQERLLERPVAGPLPTETIAMLRRLAREAVDGNWTARCAELGVQIMEWAGDCSIHGVRALGNPIWEDGSVDKLCERVVGQPSSGERELAHVLQQTVHALRPRAQDPRLLAAASALCQTLDRLATVAELQTTLTDAYRRYFGVGGSATAALQADALKRVCVGLAALHENLRRLPDSATPVDGPPETDDATIYRD